MLNDERNERETLAGPPPHDELDGLLHEWHATNTRHARAQRDALLRAIAREEKMGSMTRSHDRARMIHAPRATVTRRPSRSSIITRLFIAPQLRAAASLLLVATIITLLLPAGTQPAFACEELLLPEGGRLEAMDGRGNVIGPCALEHTDVDVEISGPFARVTLAQQFHNPYTEKIEAVYTFPLSHRGAVDAFTMTVGDRVVIGEVKEREAARKVYEAARSQGYVAGLLEQERPNIFTQSVANIEPGADVLIEISYVETVQQREGEYRFDFPMTVAPRYIPGAPTASGTLVPAELKRRHGIVLRGPAAVDGIKIIDSQFADGVLHWAPLMQGHRVSTVQTQNANGERVPIVETPGVELMAEAKLRTLLLRARPIQPPGQEWYGADFERAPKRWAMFGVQYASGRPEFGTIYDDGTGEIAGRWFFCDLNALDSVGTGFHVNTNRVPDASRITPMPVHPSQRAGHDISISVRVDTGGPEITTWTSESHKLVKRDRARSELELDLANRSTIPNKDFLLRWRVQDDDITDAHFAHFSDQNEYGPYSGGFFTLMLQPPARVEEADVQARELIFVLDCSGSMSGFPIEKAKDVMIRAIDAMRPGDTFNVITFSSGAGKLWPDARPNTIDNRAAALAHVESRQGGGGTEMKKAVLAALTAKPMDFFTMKPLTPDGLASLPADGREVTVRIPLRAITMTSVRAPGMGGNQRFTSIAREHGEPLRADTFAIGAQTDENAFIIARGTWITKNGERHLAIDSTEIELPDADRRAGAWKPVRFCLFLTDGQIGNDNEVVQSVREHSALTRVFTVGIGNSPNRSLLDQMAAAGRGTSDYISLNGDPQAAIDRFVARIERPVLTDIQLILSDGLEILDATPSIDALPDLFDEQPLIIHGRYQTPGKGHLMLRGNTAHGPFERTINLTLPGPNDDAADEHDVVATLWARAQVDEKMKLHAGEGDRPAVIALGETFQIMTQYTSFVAVEKSRMTIGGEPRLVAIPIELPEGQSWEGTMGGWPREFELWARNTLKANPDAVRAMHVSDRSDEKPSVNFGVALGSDQGVFGDVSARLRQMQVKDKDAFINPKLERVRQLQMAMKYHEALDVVNEILAVDPLHAGGLVLKDFLNTQITYEQYRIIQRRKENNMQSSELETQERLIMPRSNISGPGMRGTSELMLYPPDWPGLSLMRYNESGYHDATQSRAVMQRMTNTTIPVDFEGNSVEQVVSFFEQVTGDSIRVDWNALESIGITKHDTVALKMRDASVASALNQTLGQLGNEHDRPQFAVKNGQLTISSDEAMRAGAFAGLVAGDLPTGASAMGAWDSYVGIGESFKQAPEGGGGASQFPSSNTAAVHLNGGYTRSDTVNGGDRSNPPVLGDIPILYQEPANQASANYTAGRLQAIWAQRADGQTIALDETSKDVHAPQLDIDAGSRRARARSAGDKGTQVETSQPELARIPITDHFKNKARTNEGHWGLWSRDTSQGSAGFWLTPATSSHQGTSFEILTTDGIRGRTRWVGAVEDEELHAGRFGWKAQDPTMFTFSVPADQVAQNNAGQPGEIRFPWQSGGRSRGEQSPDTKMMGGVRVVPIVDRNALAIVAPPEQEQAIRALIAELDQPRDASDDKKEQSAEGSNLEDLGQSDAEGTYAPASISSLDIIRTGLVPLLRELAQPGVSPVLFLDGVPLTVEPLIIFTVEMYASGDVVGAEAVAWALAAGRPDFPLTKSLYHALTRQVYTDQGRSRELRAIALTAQSRIDAFALNQWMQAHLARVLDERLQPFALASGLPTEFVEGYDGPAPTDTAWKDGGVLLTVLLDQPDDATRDELETAGLRIEDQAESKPLVVGVLPLGRLAQLSLVNGVRRIEPTQVSSPQRR